MSRKVFKVKIEQELEISFDMNKYNPETISTVADYWGFDGNQETFFEELTDFIVCKYIKDGYFDYETEGLVIDGHEGKLSELWMQIDEKE